MSPKPLLTPLLSHYPLFRPEDDQGGDLFVALSGGSFSGQRPVMTPRGGTSNLGIVLSTPRGEQSAGATPSPSSSRPNGLLGTRPMGSGRLVTPGKHSLRCSLRYCWRCLASAPFFFSTFICIVQGIPEMVPLS